MRSVRFLVLLGMAWSLPAGATAPSLVYHGVDPLEGITAQERAIAREIQRLVAESPGDVTIDATLVRAARRLARQDGVPRDALVAAGVSDVFAIPVRYTLLDGIRAVAPVEQLLGGEVRRARVTHFGVGVFGTGSTRRVGMVFVRRGADLSRFPRHVEVGDRFLLNGRVDAAFQKPLVLLATPAGQIAEIRPRFEHRVFWLQIPFEDGPGRYHIEVQARDRYGVQVLNLMEVYAFEPGTPREAPVVRLRPADRPVGDRAEAEERAVRLINRARRIAGIAKLHVSGALRSEARAHSSDMSGSAWFGHVSPRRGGLAARLRSAGLGRLLARENVAIAPSPELAHSELVRSPSHLRNILDGEVTHIGVGAVERETGTQPVFTFTQIFARL